MKKLILIISLLLPLFCFSQDSLDLRIKKIEIDQKRINMHLQRSVTQLKQGVLISVVGTVAGILIAGNVIEISDSDSRKFLISGSCAMVLAGGMGAAVSKRHLNNLNMEAPGLWIYK